MIPKVTIIAIGKIKDPSLQALAQEYRKRLQPLLKVEVIELNDEGMIKESKKVEGYLGQTTYILDNKGQQLSSEGFSALLQKHDLPVTLIIGGPEGFTPALKAKAGKQLLSLSPMTFTHEMARVILLEQVYRAMMIIQKKPYHK